jgi:hypothetical protein
MFHIVSWTDWLDPEKGYYRKDDVQAKKRHQQAWAYDAVAKSLEADQRWSHAANLHRKTAIAWELSDWSEHPPENTTEVEKHRWTTDKLFDEKWRIAGRSYFKAAQNAIRADHDGIRGEREILTSYAPQEVGWGGHVWGAEKAGLDEPVFERANDVERMERCWRMYGEKRGALAEAIEETCRHLSVLQNDLARMGRRKQAAKVHRRRQKLAIEVAARRKSPALPFKWLYWQATGSGTSIVRTLASVCVLYVVLFPLLFLAGGWIEHIAEPATAVNFGDALRYSIGNVVSMDVWGCAPRGLWGSVMQTLQGISAYFVLGFSAWVVLRSFEE